MFCPVCKAEYRPGFTRCADCDVELVWELPAAAMLRHADAEPGDDEEDPFCSFWKGDDPRILAELCELLDKEKIPHKTVRREDHLFHMSNFSAFQIGIPFSMFERAEAIIKEAYGSDEAVEPASHLLPMDSDHIPGTRFTAGTSGPGVRSPQEQSHGADGPPNADFSGEKLEDVNAESEEINRDSENQDLEDAQIEVWSGSEPEPAEFIGASLQVNQIPFRQAVHGGKYFLYVLAEDEARAREIVREVVDGVPPE